MSECPDQGAEARLAPHASADPNALWTTVHDQCLPDQESNNDPAPCSLVALGTGEPRGYAVLYTNPRGSKGYGEAFTSRIFADWGNQDAADCMAAVDHALARELFTIPGVSSLLLLGDFITVNKRPDVAWRQITTAVEKVLASAT